MRSCAALGLSLLLSGCSGLFLIGEDQLVPAAVECESSAECGTGMVCEGGHCVESEVACSVSTPEGFCPHGRLCDAGVCVLEQTGGGDPPAGCDCDPDEACFDSACVPTGVNLDEPCSAAAPTGLCPAGEVCIGGTCTRLVAATTCSLENPKCSCPQGAACDGGFCVPIAESPCVPGNPDGLCPAGQSCEAGACLAVPCSYNAPCGVCLVIGEACVDGACVPAGTLDTCADLDCEGHFRLGCDSAGAYPVCLGCLDGYMEDAVDPALCVPILCASLACGLLARLCDESGDVPVCGDCIADYHDTGAAACLPNTCADADCATRHRGCSDASFPPICTTCLAGYHELAGDCVADACADIDCAAQNRECDDTAGPAACTTCLAGYNENALGECTNCTLTADCPAGQFCSVAEGRCMQECDPLIETLCANGQICSPYGRCLSPLADPANGVCAAAITEGELVEPTVMILVDQSGSMNVNYPAVCGGAGQPVCQWRWDALRDVLLGELAVDGIEGIVWRLQAVVRFGIVFYTQSGANNAVTCPTLTNVTRQFGQCSNNPAIACSNTTPCGGNPCTQIKNPYAVSGAGAGTLPALDNAAAMQALYDSLTIASDTPTGDSIDVMVDYLTWLGGTSPKYIVLATDGEPDRCEELNPQNGQAEAVAAAGRAWDNGVQLFNISVGADVSTQHMQDVANAGSGVDPAACPAPGDAGCAPLFLGTDPDALAAGLETIIGSVLSCVIQLDATDDPVSGELAIDGEVIPLDPFNGWSLDAAARTVTLNGASCAAVTDGAEHYIAVQFDTCGGG